MVSIAGTCHTGLWGGRVRKPMLLTGPRLGRAPAIATFATLPVSAETAHAFGVVMGLLWLSTVPLTNGTVASVWGARHMSMLGGAVFLAIGWAPSRAAGWAARFTTAPAPGTRPGASRSRSASSPPR